MRGALGGRTGAVASRLATGGADEPQPGRAAEAAGRYAAGGLDRGAARRGRPGVAAGRTAGTFGTEPCCAVGRTSPSCARRSAADLTGVIRVSSQGSRRRAGPGSAAEGRPGRQPTRCRRADIEGAPRGQRPPASRRPGRPTTLTVDRRRAGPASGSAVLRGRADRWCEPECGPAGRGSRRRVGLTLHRLPTEALARCRLSGHPGPRTAALSGPATG